MADDAKGSFPGRLALTPSCDLEDLRRRMIRLAVKLIWNRDDAEDIVQEALKISVSSGLSMTEGRFTPWMIRTVANLCLNHRRRRRPEPLAPWIESPDSESPLTRAQNAEQLTRLRDAIESLPPQQRLAIILRTQEQMDYPEIAEVMNLSEAAVRTHVHHARRQLSKSWEGPST